MPLPNHELVFLAGQASKKKAAREQLYSRIMQLHKEGLATVTIAERLGLNWSTVQRTIKERNDGP